MAETKAANTDIEKAVKSLTDRQIGYTKFANYYDGDHELQFATEKFKNAFGKLFHEFALNLCPAICDAVRDKLILTGFGVEEAAGETDIPNAAWKIWQDNRMTTRSGQIHREAVVNGDAYAIVWVDAEKRTTIYPNKAATCTVMYDEETPGKILWAAKYWPVTIGKDKRIRLNLYYPDRIERYISEKKVDGELPKESKAYIEYTDDGGKAVIANPYGVVPVFHFGNNSDIGSFGRSEISSAVPVQDALNKSVLDMLVTMEFSSYRQRWATGIELEIDDATGKAMPPYIAGIERLWINENPDVKFGTFDESNIEHFIKVKDGFRVDLAAVSGTPLYYFMQTGAQFPSGESLKKAETRFINKVRDRQESFGQVWEDLMSFALRIDGGKKDIRLFAEWEDPAPMSEKEQLEVLMQKQDLGIPDEQLWSEAGYGEDDIKKFTEAKAQAAEDAVTRFNAGEEEPVPVNSE
ncbi:MAG: phage portal protein [Candidatus Moraniibacteriota bacterium]